MSRSTLANAKDTDLCNIAGLLNISPNDPRFVTYVNRAQRRLVQTGKMFWGLYGRYAFCVTEGCLTWPRQIASIQTVAVCGQPIPIRNEWFEFMESVGIQDEQCGNRRCGGMQLYDRGSACTFNDIRGQANKKIKIYADVAEDADAVILLRGYDQNGNFVRTQVDGEWIDGEYVGISTTPQTSFNIFTSLVSVIKPVTNGVVRLYEYDTDLATQRAIAVYEPDETNPSYRRSYIGGLVSGRGCCGSDEDCQTKTVTAEAKLEFIPVKNDNDWLMIGNLGALEMACNAILKEDMNLFGEAAVYMNGGNLGGSYVKGAVGILEDELRHYLGSPIQPIKMQPRRVGGSGVLNLIG